MMSFRNTTTALLHSLREQLPAIPVNFGRYGELPSVTPAILLYAEPFGNTNDSLGNRSLRFAKFTLFSLDGGSENIEESIFNSIELLEKAEIALRNFELRNNAELSLTSDPVTFDAVYNNIAVAYLEFILPYKREATL